MQQGGETIGPRLERGLGYVTVGPADASSAFLRSSPQARTPYLWITWRIAPHPAEGGEVRQVTSLAGVPGTVDPKRLADVCSAAIEFLDAHPESLVVLDCLEYLALHNGVERVERAVADLHDEVTMRGGTLVVFVDVRSANPRLVAWLERELDVLPTALLPAPEADALWA